MPDEDKSKEQLIRELEELRARVSELEAIEPDRSESKTDDALKESEAKWRSLVESAPDLVIMFDAQGKILFINRTVEGFVVEETIGKSVFDFVLK